MTAAQSLSETENEDVLLGDSSADCEFWILTPEFLSPHFSLSVFHFAFFIAAQRHPSNLPLIHFGGRCSSTTRRAR